MDENKITSINNSYVNETITMEDFEKEYENIPGIKEFFDLLATPDSVFDIIYPELRAGILEQIGAPETIALIEQTKLEPEYQTIMEKIPELIASFKNIEDISQNKIDFLTLLFSMYLEEYDVVIDVELAHDNAQLPAYAKVNDAGADIYAIEDITVPAGSMGFKIPTGLKMAIPKGWQIAVRPRSGMSNKTQIRISNTPGTVDTGYRDEIGVLVDNFDRVPYEIKKGDRIAQFVVEKAYKAKWNKVDNVANIGQNRGGGFGHSGR